MIVPIKGNGRFLTALRARGFTLEAGRLLPPENSTGETVIARLTAAFQEARGS